MEIVRCQTREQKRGRDATGPVLPIISSVPRTHHHECEDESESRAMLFFGVAVAFAVVTVDEWLRRMPVYLKYPEIFPLLHILHDYPANGHEGDFTVIPG